MSCNPVSYFPNKVDEMIFFQDNNLENVEVMNHYNELITQGKYTEANDYIEEEDIPINCFHIFTDTDEDEDLSLVRLFEDENSNEDGESINIMHVFAGCYAEIEEDFSSIVLFSDNDEQESLENLYIFTGEEEPPPNADIDTIWI